MSGAELGQTRDPLALISGNSAAIRAHAAFLTDQGETLRTVGDGLRLWVPETRPTSCDLLVFVDEAAESIKSADAVDLGLAWWWWESA